VIVLSILHDHGRGPGAGRGAGRARAGRGLGAGRAWAGRGPGVGRDDGAFEAGGVEGVLDSFTTSAQATGSTGLVG
jgi:hypothetical protein